MLLDALTRADPLLNITYITRITTECPPNLSVQRTYCNGKNAPLSFKAVGLPAARTEALGDELGHVENPKHLICHKT